MLRCQSFRKFGNASKSSGEVNETKNINIPSVVMRLKVRWTIL